MTWVSIFIHKGPCTLMNQRRLEVSPALLRFYHCLRSLPWVHADGLCWHERLRLIRTHRYGGFSITPSVAVLLFASLWGVQWNSAVAAEAAVWRPGRRAEAGGVQGRANHRLIGNTFLHRLNCPFYDSGGEVAGIQEKPGVQRQGTILK